MLVARVLPRGCRSRLIHPVTIPMLPFFVHGAVDRSWTGVSSRGVGAKPQFRCLIGVAEKGHDTQDGLPIRPGNSQITLADHIVGREWVW